MTAALAARGPDGEGFHVAWPIGLGHRRLAVIDVAGGRQPLFGCAAGGAAAAGGAGAAVIVNGEIYNFAALRKELRAAGHRFATKSDSEVIVHGYEEWGAGLLDRLEGMFAFAVWDGAAQRLLLARDRMGEKPLYWTRLPGGGLAFASELKALRHAPGVDDRIDPAALARYLVYEYVPAPHSILRGVFKLEAGTFLVATPGGEPEVRRYWDLPLHPSDSKADTETAANDLLAELRRSVRERLVSDVPLGIFLSGGIDSSAVAALACEARGGEIDTFSLGFDDPSFDETAQARRVARAIGSRHHEDRLSPAALLDLLPAIGDLLDEPLGDGSIAPTHLLARFARRHVTVALGGDGGDELFAGYPTFQAERIAGLLDHAPRAIAHALGRLGSALATRLPVSTAYFSLDFRLRQFLKGIDSTGARRHQAWLGSFAPADALAALAPDAARAALSEPRGIGPPTQAVAGEDDHAAAPTADRLLDAVDARIHAAPTADRWGRLLYFYARGYLTDDVLTKVDRATMAVGLECRSPFLDTRVVSLACRLPPPLRMRGFTGKYLLRRALRGILPDETLSRRKQGFAMPIGRWLRHELRPFLEETLSRRALGDTGLFDPAPIRRLVDAHVAGAADHRKPLWTLIAFLRWHAAWTAAAAVPAGVA